MINQDIKHNKIITCVNKALYLNGGKDTTCENYIRYSGGQKSLGQLSKTFPEQRNAVLQERYPPSKSRDTFEIIQVCSLTLPPPPSNNLVINKQLLGLGKVYTEHIKFNIVLGVGGGGTQFDSYHVNKMSQDF